MSLIKGRNRENARTHVESISVEKRGERKTQTQRQTSRGNDIIIRRIRTVVVGVVVTVVDWIFSKLQSTNDVSVPLALPKLFKPAPLFSGEKSGGGVIIGTGSRTIRQHPACFFTSRAICSRCHNISNWPWPHLTLLLPPTHLLTLTFNNARRCCPTVDTQTFFAIVTPVRALLPRWRVPYKPHLVRLKGQNDDAANRTALVQPTWVKIEFEKLKKTKSYQDNVGQNGSAP